MNFTKTEVDAKSKRQQRKKIVKNLEEEVELVLSQDGSNANEEKKSNNVDTAYVNSPQINIPGTPNSLRKTAQDVITPRRSTRKSIKPSLDYNEIVSSKGLRSATKDIEIFKHNANQSNKKKRAKMVLNLSGCEEILDDVYMEEDLKNKTEKRTSQKLVLKDAEGAANINSSNDDLIPVKDKQKTEPLFNVDYKNKKTNGVENDLAEKSNQPRNVNVPKVVLTDTENLSNTIIKSSVISVVDEVNINNESIFDVKNIEQVEVSKIFDNTKDLCDKNVDTKSKNRGVPKIVLTNEDNLSNTIVNPTSENNENMTNINKDCVSSSKTEAQVIKLSSNKNTNEDDIYTLIISDDEDDFESKLNLSKQIKHCDTDLEDEEFPSLLLSEDEDNSSAAFPEQTVAEKESKEQIISLEIEICNTPKSKHKEANNKTSANNFKPFQDMIMSEQKKANKNSTPVKNLKILNCNVPTPSKVLSTPRIDMQKQKDRPKALRFPTPYKPKKEFKFNLSDEEQLDNENHSKPVLAVTPMESKDAAVRRMRKRSTSVTSDDKVKMKPQRKVKVTFYSPANQTTNINDLDVRIADSIKKNDKNHHVTTRRKRSISFDENMMPSSNKTSKPDYSGTTNKFRSTPQKLAQKRTVLPNFAAIHQKQFEKMENLVDHVARKAERAKILSNSTGKLLSTSKTNATSLKNNSICVTPVKPKASKKINLDTTIEIPTKLKKEDVENEQKLLERLPNPRLAIIPAISAYNPIVKKSNQPAVVKKEILKPTAQIQKPLCNQQTILHKKPFDSFTAIPQQSKMSDDKVAARREKHMNMFKTRAGSVRTGAKNVEIIRGVRSNRRFELQMQHRKNVDNN